MTRRVLKLKARYPDEGPRKIREYLLRDDAASEHVPAASTIGAILKSHDLVEARSRRRPSMQSVPKHLTEPSHPNQVWSIDFKGDFLVDGMRCYPLTMKDGFSRYTFAIRAQDGTGYKETSRNVFRVFREFGLPEVMRCDNGCPFVYSRAPLGLSRLMVDWIRLGIRVERTEPGMPAQNGRHERFHKSLKRRTAKPPAQSWAAQQKRFDRYRRHYNHCRPHEALGMKSPENVFRPSPRELPARIPPIEHKDVQDVVPVFTDGSIYFRSIYFHLTEALQGDTVGITEIEDDIYKITYGPLYLGNLNFRGQTATIHALT